MPTGSRPTAVKQTRYEWVYLYAAVEAATGANVALQAPHVNTGTMNVFLEMVSAELAPLEHGILIMDQAGWHKSRGLRVPDNLTILYLPPYSPELNPVERLWAYLRDHFLSNRAYDDYRHLLDAGRTKPGRPSPQKSSAPSAHARTSRTRQGCDPYQSFLRITFAGRPTFVARRRSPRPAPPPPPAGPWTPRPTARRSARCR